MKQKILIIAVFILIISNVFSQNIPTYIPKDGLVGWWPFNGNANDESGHGYHGTVYGATLTADRNGNPNSAYSFNGISDYLEFINPDKKNNFTFFDPNLSFSLWIKKNVCNTKGVDSKILISDDSDDYSNTNALSICGSSGNIPLDANNNLYGDGICVSNYVKRYQHYKLLPSEGWIHIAYNNNTRCFYINNRKFCIDQKKDPSSIWKSRVSNMLLAKGFVNSWANMDNFFDGIIDNFALYNRPLTDEEVENLYLERLKPPCVNLSTSLKIVGDLNLCDGDSTTLKANSHIGVNYQWYKDGISITNATDSIYTAKESGNYFVGLSNNPLCESTSSLYPIKVFSKLTNVTPVLKDTTLCEGQYMILSPKNNKDGYRFQWKKDNIRIANATSQNYFANSPGTYSLVTYSYCNDSIENNIITIYHNVIPSSNFIINAKVNKCHDTIKFDLKNKNGYTFKWYFNGSPTPLIGENDSVLFAKQSGYYYVQYSKGNCYKTISSKYFEFNNVNIEFGVESDKSNDSICTGSIKVISLSGQKPFTYKWSTGDTTSNLFNLCSGSYSLMIIDSNNCSFEKNINVGLIQNNTKFIQGIGVSDIDGNKYKTVLIGDQEWMSENLRVTKFNDGSLIKNITDDLEWKNKADGWCLYNNDSSYNNEMGKLYSQISIWEKNVCPMGWHIPLEKDWDTLIRVIGGPEISGIMLRNSLFNVEYGGYRKDDGSYANIGKVGYWMSLSGTSAGSDIAKSISDSSVIFNSLAHKYYGVSIRCVKDSSPNCTTENSIEIKNICSSNYIWNNQTYTQSGVYTFTTKNKIGCDSTATLNLTITTPLKDLKILGDSVVKVGDELLLTSNYQNYQGSWTATPVETNKIDSSGRLTALKTGNVQVMLIVKNGVCQDTAIKSLTIQPKVDLCSGFFGNLIVENDLAEDTICTGSIKSYVYNGKKPYRYSWSTGDTIDKLFNLCPNFYTLTVTDSNKCSFEKRVDIISSNIKILQGSDIKDIDGNKYQTVKIGNQEWMSENLRVTKFNDGTIIQNITDELDWKHTAGGWCYYNNDSIHNNEMGKLYSQISVGWKNACPTGWHIPLEKDWDTLIRVLGGSEISGSILRKSLFNVVYGGYRKDDGSFANIGKIGYWMSLTGTGASSAHAKSISDSSAIFNSLAHKYYGVSIRCVKDIISNDSLDLCSGFFGNLISENDLSGDTICTGKITSNVGGGLQPYSYQWSNGANTPIISGLCAQSYTLEVTDKNNCKLIFTKSIGVDTLKNPCASFKGYINSVEATGINSSSCNGSVSTYVEGGTLPYSYAWSNGVTTSSITEVCQGEYTLTVTDAAKCALTLSAKVKVDSTKNACTGFYTKVISSKDDTNINGQCSGAIHTKVFGGKLPYSIKWNNGSTDSVLMNLCAGTYRMDVSDANNCTFTRSIEIKSTQVVDPCKDFYAVITDLKDDQANSGSCTGSMIATAKGGKLPYSYQWNTGDTTSSLQNQCAGEYQVTINDGNQCSLVVSTSIVKIGQQQTNLSVEIITKDASNIQACDGSMYVKVLNGTAPYTYSHSNGATTSDRTGICSGVYTVTVKDAKGLENTATYVISNPINTITTVVKTLKDSVSLDTLKTQLKNNCSINYNAIDSVNIKEAQFVSLDTVLVTWAVYANNTTTYVSQKYGLNKGSGVYALALTMYCKELKGIGNYFTATQKYYFKGKSVTTGVEKLTDNTPLNVYPNPFRDKVQVELDRMGDYKLILFDVTGKILTEKSYLNTNHMELDLEQLEAGEYLLKVMNEEFVQTRMITK